MMFFLHSVLLCFLADFSQATFFYPDVATSLLEHILVDTHGAKASNFTTAITPCSNYVDVPGPDGEAVGKITAAQWIETAFSDFITADVVSRSGGIDASVGFETSRFGHSRSALNSSLLFFRPFFNSYISMSDIIALAAVMSVQNCGGPQISFRPGRTDASQASDESYPTPDTDLQTTLSYFSRAGFSQSDAIGITACTHTLGGLDHTYYPGVISASAINPNNTSGTVYFDSSFAEFDDTIIIEYLGGTGQRGGPLVTTDNITCRYDLRLFESDSNATINAMVTEGNAGFKQSCGKLITRMINTVPFTATLRDVIVPLPIKPLDVTYDLDESLDLIFSGSFRTLTMSAAETPVSLGLNIADAYTASLTPDPGHGYSVFGNTTYFPFKINASKDYGLSRLISASISGAWSDFTPTLSVYVPGMQSEEFIFKAPIAFIVPSFTKITSSNSRTYVNITVAWASEIEQSNIKIKVSTPVPQQGSLVPRIIEFEGVDLKLDDYESQWNIASGSTSVENIVTGLVSVDLLLYGAVWDTVLLNNGVAGW